MSEFPQPVPDRDSAPFWDGLRRGRLLVQSCVACRRGIFPPQPGRCPFCRGEVMWRDIRRDGSVYSWVGVEHAIHPWQVDTVPYSVVLAEMEELPDVRIPCFAPERAQELSLGARGQVVLRDGRPTFKR